MQCRSQDAVQLSKTPSLAACAHLALSTVRSSLGSSGSRCLYSFSNKQTSLEMHTPPITWTDRSTGTEDRRFYQWMWAGRACRHRSSSSQGSPFPLGLLALLSRTRAQDVARWIWDRMPDVIHQHLGLSSDPEQGSELPLSLPRRKQWGTLPSSW